MTAEAQEERDRRYYLDSLKEAMEAAAMSEEQRSVFVTVFMGQALYLRFDKGLTVGKSENSEN